MAKTLAEKQTHLRMLLEVAKVDGHYSEIEGIYIRTVAKTLEIDPAELTGDFDRNKLSLPKYEYMLYSLFHRLLLMGIVDGVMQETQKDLCLEFGIRMGLNPSAVMEAIRYVEATKNASMPREVVAIFYKFLN